MPRILNLTHDERPELSGAFFTLRDETGSPIAIVLDPDQDTVPDGDVAAAEEANAKRLRDCWNACEEGGTLHTLLVRLAGRQIDASATAQDRVDAADAAAVLRALGG